MNHIIKLFSSFVNTAMLKYLSSKLHLIFCLTTKINPWDLPRSTFVVTTKNLGNYKKLLDH